MWKGYKNLEAFFPVVLSSGRIKERDNLFLYFYPVVPPLVDFSRVTPIQHVNGPFCI